MQTEQKTRMHQMNQITYGHTHTEEAYQTAPYEDMQSNQTTQRSYRKERQMENKKILEKKQLLEKPLNELFKLYFEKFQEGWPSMVTMFMDEEKKKEALVTCLLENHPYTYYYMKPGRIY